MDYWLAITVLLIMGGAIVAIMIQWFRAFFKWPLQSSIRALLGLVALLVAALGIPVVEAKADLSMDWGRALQIESSNVVITTGVPIVIQVLAWCSLSALIGICLFRVPATPPDDPKSVFVIKADLDDFGSTAESRKVE